MAYIIGQDRDQLSFGSLSDAIGMNNPVRFVDAFVESLDLIKLGFNIKVQSEEGRPAFDPMVFMKLYLYGYLNGVRSSRKLERECRCNIEVHWLLGRLVPNYHSIADFRKDNPRALKALFKYYVLFLKDQDLIGGEVAAIDGTKFRASNSKKNNYNPKKLERHLKYIEEKTAEYLQQLEAQDANEQHTEEPTNISEKLERLQKNKLKYEQMQDQLEATGMPQISTTDPDARALLVQGQVVEVSYNQQAAVDSKHKLVVATHTLNTNDRNALSRIALETQSILQSKNLTVLVDKGYHNGRELQTTQQAQIETIVAPPTAVNSNTHGTTPDYLVQHFRYDAATDTYTCPQEQILRTTGAWHKKTRARDSLRFKKYRTAACATCAVKHLCTGRAQGGREIDRSEYAEAVARNAKNYEQHKALYRTRQELNEHIFGTIKRQWNMHYTNLRTLRKVDGELSLVMMVYNIKRSMNILGIPELLNRLKTWVPKYPKAPKPTPTALESGQIRRLKLSTHPMAA